MKTKKYFYRKVLVSTICTGSIIVYLLSNSKILGAAPSGDFSYLHMEQINDTVGQIVDVEAQEEIFTTNNLDSAAIIDGSAGEINETMVEMNSEVDSGEAQENIYIVKEGETLWEIAQEIDISIQDLLQENNLSNGIVSEGQELFINSNT